MTLDEATALMGAAIFIAVFAVPIAMFYYVGEFGLDVWVAIGVSALAIIVGGVLAMVTMVVAYQSLSERGGTVNRIMKRIWEEYGEKGLAYSARQRAMLEELDEIVELLREIRDLLKGEYDETRKY
ncbi:MAG: hypothetical protein DRN04_06275 [Thermoprotei archaeon]|nr:MAG: hypothetical protein DRN04_06275 [Thermoprotei archaeon]